VLYEMLAGDPPFVASSPRAVLAKHLTEKAPPITTVRSSVPRPVAAALTRALGKASADRYTSVHEFAEALTGKASKSAPPTGQSVAVLPLENLMGDAGQEFFVDGMTEALIANLVKVGSIKVISRTSVMQYKGTRKPLPEIASELRVGALVEGSVMRAGNQVRITAQLIDAASDQHLWAESYDGTLDDIFALQSQVAGAIAREIRTALTPEEERRLAPGRQVDLAAYDLYLRGRQCQFTWEEEGLNRSVRYFEQAFEKDPGWALPCAAQAESHYMLSFITRDSPAEHLKKARSAAERAVGLDETLGDPLAILAAVRVIEDYDWSRAGFEFARAIELSPASYTSHMPYGALFLTALGDLDRAEAEVRFCMELDPLNPAAHMELGWVLFAARRIDDAIGQLNAALTMDANSPMAVGLLGLAHIEVSAVENGVAELEKAVALTDRAPFFLVLLARGYAAAGRSEEALELLGQVSARWPDTYTTPYYMAAAYEALGQNDRAIDWLEKAYEVRDPWLVVANEDPALDGLRSDGRFQDLMRRMKFPKIRS
jgi:adenylate cyclase